MSSIEQAIRDFISMGHPPSSEYNEWAKHLLAYGESVPAVLLDILENGLFQQKPAAIYGLRVFGYEAVAEGSWENEIYKVKRKQDADWITIKPKIVAKYPYQF
ncbi:MAG: hypothetical protein AB1489_37265 [Acidobacteriota bacterium]